MKHLISIAFISIVGISFSQKQNRTDIAKMLEEYHDFVAITQGAASEAPIGGVLLDASENPSVQFTLPFTRENSLNPFYLKGKISSTNNYTPLINNKKWIPDVSANLNWTRFLVKKTQFYTNNFQGVTPQKLQDAVNKAKICDASSIFWIWLNAKAGYNYATYELFQNDTLLLNSQKVYEENSHQFNGAIDLNAYYYPSRNRAKWLTITARVGYEFKLNDNNFNSLTSLKIKEIETSTDNLGNKIEISGDENSVRSGTFITSNSHNLNYNLTLFASTNRDKIKYIALNTFGKTRLNGVLKSTNLGVGFRFPISKESDGTAKPNAATIELQYEVTDVFDQISNLRIQEKGNLGVTLGLPIKLHNEDCKD